MVLKVEQVQFSYTVGKPVFSNVSFYVRPGEIVSIVGPSGTGKSTLLKCIAGYLSLEEGKVLIEGEEMIDPKHLLKMGHPEIALVDQLFELDDYFTVKENIYNQLHHLDIATRNSFVAELIGVFELEEVAHLQSKDISGGEKQRLTMACALAKEPKCLLLDEPFVHFDVHLHKKIGEYLKKLVEVRQMAVLLVTHNGTEALAWSKRILMMKNGKMQSKYTPEQAYFKPKSLYEGRFFGELNSVYIQQKQRLFRPIEYALTQTDIYQNEIEVTFLNADFKGPYFANYFKIKGGKEIVLYSLEKLKNTHKIYV